MTSATTVTYAPDFEVVLTRRCAYSCGYCQFPRTPSPQPPSHKALRRLTQAAMRLGASQVTLSAGEGIDTLTELVSVSRYYGYDSWWAYIRACCEIILRERGARPLVPVLEVGAIPLSELKAMREVVGGVRLMLDSGDDRLMAGPVHGTAPHKDPAWRAAALEDLGRWSIPTTTGILIGLGESPESWELTARVVNGLHLRHGHIQNFVLRLFEPQPFTPMEMQCPAPDSQLLRAVRIVRGTLDRRICLSVETHGRPQLAVAAARAGAVDLGAFRMGSNGRYDCDAVEVLEQIRGSLALHGLGLCERGPILEGCAIEPPLSDRVTRNLERQAAKRIHEITLVPQDAAACG